MRQRSCRPEPRSWGSHLSTWYWNWPHQCRLTGASKEKKYLWNIFISHDGWVVTHRGCKKWEANFRFLLPVASSPEPDRRDTVSARRGGHCVAFPSPFLLLCLSCPPFLFSSLSPASLSGCPSRPPTSLQPSPTPRFGFSDSGNEMFHYLHFTAFNRERI